MTGMRVFGLLVMCGAFVACSASPNGFFVGGDSGAQPTESLAPEEEAEEEEEETTDAGKTDAGSKDAGKKDAAKEAGKDSGKVDAAGGDAGSAATDSGSGTTFAGGTTVADCQGSTSLSADFNGATPDVSSGFAVYSGGQHNIFAYSRATVTDYAYGGQAGENKVRLLVSQITGPGEYQGIMSVSRWDTAQGKWTDYDAPSQVVVVTVTAWAPVVMPTGLMCNAWYVGHAEALFTGNNPVAFSFSVPLLTPSFPKSNPGPP